MLTKVFFGVIETLKDDSIKKLNTEIFYYQNLLKLRIENYFNNIALVNIKKT